jgi:hypothetical protein
MSAMLHREGYAPSFGTDRFSEVGSAARGAGGKLDRDGITSSHRHWLERLVFGLDSVLRRWQSIIEYSRDPNCILRIKLERLDSEMWLRMERSAAPATASSICTSGTSESPESPNRGRRLHGRDRCICASGIRCAS